MNLPPAEHLKALFEAARAARVVKLKITAEGCEVELAPPSVVDDIEQRAPLKGDPFDRIHASVSEGPIDRQRGLGGDGFGARPDVIEALADGVQLVSQDPVDPSRPV